MIQFHSQTPVHGIYGLTVLMTLIAWARSWFRAIPFVDIFLDFDIWHDEKVWGLNARDARSNQLNFAIKAWLETQLSRWSAHSYYLINIYSHLYFLYKVVIPLSLPIIVTVSLFSFILSWNAFAWPLLILTKEDWFPVTVSIYGFIREVGPNVNLLMAASVISIVPILILYFFTQRLFLESISNFGIKE